VPTNDDDDLAARLAERAGALLLEVRRQAGGADPRSVGAEGDRRSHELLMAALAAERPDDAVLSEETAAAEVEARDRRRAGARRVWIVDPLDGTREFSEGRADFAVHVGLVEDGAAVAGAVALPAENLVFDTAQPATLPERPPGRLRLVVSRTRPPAEAERLARHIDAEVLAMGSAGVKTMCVVRAQADIYLHAGGQYEWDSAAPVAVALRAGAHASRLDGTPLVYNQADPWMPDLLVCRPELADTVLSVLGAAP
jgi:3'(2'), 5'-bisphosphate nucleotidase